MGQFTEFNLSFSEVKCFGIILSESFCTEGIFVPTPTHLFHSSERDFFFFALLGQSNPLSRTVSCLTIIQLSQRTVWFARTLMRDQAMEKYDHLEPLTTSKLQCFLSTKGLMQVFFYYGSEAKQSPHTEP